MSVSENSCIVGQCFNKKCNINATQELLAVNSLTAEDIKLLSLRIPALTDISQGYICHRHHDRFLKYFSSYEKKCVDPWHKHRNTVITNLRVVNSSLAKNIEEACGTKIIPGTKICINCLKEVTTSIKDNEEKLKHCIDPFERHRTLINSEFCLDQESPFYLEKIFNKQYKAEEKICSCCSLRLKSTVSEYKKTEEVFETEMLYTESNSKSCLITNSTTEVTEDTPSSEYQSCSQKKIILDNYLQVFDIPPFKRQKLTDNRVIQEGVDIIQNVVGKVIDVFGEVNNVSFPTDFKNLKRMQEQSLALDSIISNLQKKYKICTFNEKINILALLPDDWKLKKIQELFQCSFYMFNEAKKLKLQGPKFQRVRKMYFRVSPEVRKEIVEFYLDDKNSVMCSGMKQLKKIHLDGGSSIKVHTKMLLHDLKSLYNDWVKETKQTKIPCFAFFCQLKPDQCIFAGDPGTHNICVCDKHQNLKLKLAAAKLKIDYREIIAVGVCSINYKNCMLQECDICPGKEGIRDYITSHINIDNTVQVTYANWTTVAIENKKSEKISSTRIALQDFEEPYSEFIDNLICDIWVIRKHHFISSEQKNYYSECKKNLEQNTGLMVMDFAENYAFISQNSTQGFYFNNAQASLFTVALYYRNRHNNEVDVACFCVISDSTNHQAYSVHIFQEAILNIIKIEYSWVKKLIYFSDGAPTQFKNKNNFINLCHHKEDFGLEIHSYNFFATSHGKSACDGIGAIAKGSARKASLQNVRILDAQEMFDYLNEKESSIKFCFVAAKDVEAREKMLYKRFKSAKTLANTRDIHRYEPINNKQMIVRLFSTDTDVKVQNLT